MDMNFNIVEVHTDCIKGVYRYYVHYYKAELMPTKYFKIITGEPDGVNYKPIEHAEQILSFMRSHTCTKHKRNGITVRVYK